MNRSEEEVTDYYKRYWSTFVQWWNAGETLGLHLGYYEKSIDNHVQAIFNMNDFVGRLLCLDRNKPMKILDAGCGIGGTSIHLAKKHKNVTFTGITNTFLQVELANKFSQERDVNDNTKFILGDYIETGFPDNHFDGAFSLESVCYAPDKDDYLHEMYRILKPGGRLVVVDGFRTDVLLNPFMQKIYHIWRSSRGNPDMSNLKTFTSYLETTGFKEITVKDISKNISRSYMRAFILGIPFFFASTLKRMIKWRSYEPTRDVDLFMSGSVYACILGLNNISGYYAITAVKK
jgi:tocopherol O-methyltransferase